MSSCLTDDVPMPVWLRGVLAVVALGGVAYGLGLLSFLEDDAKAGGGAPSRRGGATPSWFPPWHGHP